MSGKRAAGSVVRPAAPVDGPAVPSTRADMRRAKKRGRRKAVKITAFTAAGILVLGCGGVGYLYFHLAGNIKSASLYTGNDKAAAVGVEKPDALGRTPYNLLLIGSDTRDTSADAAAGGDAGAGANADVEMLVHLSADRSNITVMSIPRDLMTNLPACTDTATGVSKPPRYAQINSSLQLGPSCTAESIHKLTGITVDDFAMVDFSGVEAMSDALGGVNVCFTHNLYDLNSGLKLTAGTHNLKGKAALQFLRTRDSFGDGSDNVGRTTATHVFFTDMINKLKSGGTLSSPVALLSIANAATRALTVSPGIDNPVKLVDLAQDMNKVPTNRITFTTMQNTPDTQPGELDRVLQAPGASTLFSAIANDQSLTTSTGASSSAAKATATATASPTPAVSASSVTVNVYNGTEGDGWSDTVAKELVTDGFNPATAGYSDSDVATTTLTYGPGQLAQAQLTARTLGLPSSALKQGSSAGLKLVLGADWTSGTAFPGSKPSLPPLNTSVALNDTHSQNGAQNECVQVSTDYTQPGATPQMEFADHPNVPDSAP